MSPRRTLANAKLPPKADSETSPTNSVVIVQKLVNGFHKTVHLHHLIKDRALYAAYHTSLSRHGTAAERFENAHSLSTHYKHSIVL